MIELGNNVFFFLSGISPLSEEDWSQEVYNVLGYDEEIFD